MAINQSLTHSIIISFKNSFEGIYCTHQNISFSWNCRGHSTYYNFFYRYHIIPCLILIDLTKFLYTVKLTLNGQIGKICIWTFCMTFSFKTIGPPNRLLTLFCIWLGFNFHLKCIIDNFWNWHCIKVKFWMSKYTL
jgi:hypothetical protein